MNLIFFLLVVISFIVAAWRQIDFAPGFNSDGQPLPLPMDALTMAVIQAAEGAVELAIGLIGVMALFLGLMKIVEEEIARTRELRQKAEEQVQQRQRWIRRRKYRKNCR